MSIKIIRTDKPAPWRMSSYYASGLTVHAVKIGRNRMLGILRWNR